MSRRDKERDEETAVLTPSVGHTGQVSRRQRGFVRTNTPPAVFLGGVGPLVCVMLLLPVNRLLMWALSYSTYTLTDTTFFILALVSDPPESLNFIN